MSQSCCTHTCHQGRTCPKRLNQRDGGARVTNGTAEPMKPRPRWAAALAAVLAALSLTGCATEHTEINAIQCVQWVKDQAEPNGWRCSAWVFNEGIYSLPRWRLRLMPGAAGTGL